MVRIPHAMRHTWGLCQAMSVEPRQPLTMAWKTIAFASYLAGRPLQPLCSQDTLFQCVYVCVFLRFLEL
eukprot:5424256-Amphidinium_carterae.1